jgi:hypothetical protein
MNRPLLLGLAIVGCSSSGPSLDRASLGRLEFAVPAGWSSHDRSNKLASMIEWTPSDSDDPASLVVLRGERASVASSPNHLPSLIRAAQAQLPESVFQPPTRISTRFGLSGVRIEGDFRPDHQPTTYHRIHAVLVDGASLVHVIYTAREPDREAFDAVVESFRASPGE